MKNEYIAYMLVFAACAAVLWVLWSTAVAAGLAQGEKLDFENNLTADGRQKKPIERFVSPGALFRYCLFSAILPGVAVPVAFLVSGFDSPFFLGVAGGLFAIGGWFVPRMYYMLLVRRRQAAFEARILDLTVGLANALRAGMALPQAFERITERMTGAMREELNILLRDYRLHIPLPDAIARLAERMPCEDIRLLEASIRLTNQTGGSLAEVLAEMVETIRGRVEFKEKLLTLTAQGKYEGIVLALAPMIALGVLSCVQPDFTAPLFRTTAGWVAIGTALVMEIVGYIAIRKITAIEV
jgi:tight adherence protein B